ncbi:helix-turn-helix domain-containing protein [Mesorhizobium camelthorni]|uniref:helix-turn-helix domain-containing protein n=1 Tax=Allomesorhizobium camelthorni TaxID=475069 RepID=UPI001981534F
MPIIDVALSCGFETGSYFSKCFRDRFGISPTQMRGFKPRLIPSAATRDRKLTRPQPPDQGHQPHGEKPFGARGPPSEPYRKPHALEFPENVKPQRTGDRKALTQMNENGLWVIEPAINRPAFDTWI